MQKLMVSLSKPSCPLPTSAALIMHDDGRILTVQNSTLRQSRISFPNAHRSTRACVHVRTSNLFRPDENFLYPLDDR
jgi:hypothetical protein